MNNAHQDAVETIGHLYATHASQFARVLNGSAFPFSLDAQRTAATLRRLADRIDAGEIALQSARVDTETSVEDFCLSVVKLTFAEKAHG